MFFEFAAATNVISFRMDGCELGYNYIHVTCFPETKYFKSLVKNFPLDCTKINKRSAS